MFSSVWCIVLLAAAVGHAAEVQDSDGKDQVKSVQKRWVPRYPYNSCFALAMVVAIPLELKGRNVYMSWNFESNFYYPYFDNVQGLVPLPFATIVEPDTNLGTIVVNAAEQAGEQRNLNDLPANKTINEAPKMMKNKKATRKTRQILDNLITRKRFYRMLEDKLKGMGLNGRKCLLKSICEAAAEPLSTYNGVLGDMLHVVFTPSASADERLPKEFYEAELLGRRNECAQYSRPCPRSILDFISVFA